jgi:hypothetical protein
MKNLLIIVGLLLVTGAVLYMFFWNSGTIPGLNTQAAVATNPVQFVPVVSGTQSSITRRANFLITSKDELGALWTMIDATGFPPAVDFTKEYVVAVFEGQQPTNGYSIAVSQVGDSTDSRNVAVSITKPGSTCVLAQTVTAPYEIIEIPKTDLPLKHQDTIATASCLH